MTEADFQSKFSRWIKQRIKGTAVFELKICKDRSMPFDRVAEHQLMALRNAKHESIFYKIPDSGYDQKPFDCFSIGSAKAFVVIFFYLQRGDSTFYMIDIDTFIHEVETSDRKSITIERAEEIGLKFDINVPFRSI